MTTDSIQPVLLAGGSGTRLWPLSRSGYPKQFVSLVGDHSLFQQTCQRMASPAFSAPVVLGNLEHRFLIAEQAMECGVKLASILLEPAGRDTAPAACIAALQAAREDPERLIVLMPCDHRIVDSEAFCASILAGADYARAGSIVVFGVVPTSAHTGYGYIELGAQKEEPGSWAVGRFVEKPDLKTAEAYVESGNFLWNAGIFLFKAQVLLDAFLKFAPEIYQACAAALEAAAVDTDFVRLNESDYNSAPKISLDYAIMEKASDLTCQALQSDWDDCGSWSAVQALVEHDGDGNAVQGDVIVQGSEDCLAYNANTDSLLVLLGLKDVLAVATSDAVLIAAKERAGDVKAIVAQLTAEKRPEASLHRRVHRPWGWYESLSQLDGCYQVKCIMVKPGAKLSLQSHAHRAEHWVVVSGTVEVTRDDEVFALKQNESTYIPLGAVHRMANKTSEPAFLIEVQSGDYLGEDDIVRYDDIYGRAPQPRAAE